MAELDRDRDTDARLDVSYPVHVPPLHLLARQVRMGGDVVDVQLERVGACLLDLPRVTGPAAGGDSVEAADDRDSDGGLGPPDVLEIRVRTDLVALHVRQVGHCLRVALRAVREIPVELRALHRDLLLEERVQHYRRRPRVLHAADVVQDLAQRPRRAHERIRERQPEILRREIDHHAPPGSRAEDSVAQCS
jgi:hypothetical protein